jgi:hypothetical protein
MDQDKVVKSLRDLGGRVRREASELGGRVRREASRTWRVSNLKLEMSVLARRRKRLYAELGELAYHLMKDGALEATALASLYGQIEALEDEIALKRERIEGLEPPSSEPVEAPVAPGVEEARDKPPAARKRASASSKTTTARTAAKKSASKKTAAKKTASKKTAARSSRTGTRKGAAKTGSNSGGATRKTDPGSAEG